MENPKKCVMCGGQQLKTVIGEHHYLSLPSVILVGIDITRCATCDEEYIGIPRIEELDKTIARALLRKPARLTGPEVRFLRKQLGWSGRDFARHFGVSAEHVSRWENGVRPMGATADRLLRLSVAVETPVDDYRTESLAEIGGSDAADLVIRLEAEPEWRAA